jgi:hypothetical protein
LGGALEIANRMPCEKSAHSGGEVARTRLTLLVTEMMTSPV